MLLKVSASPHFRDHDTTASIMRDVCISLIPALVMATWLFGSRALMLTLITVCSCVFWEWLSCLLMKREQSVGDWSAVVTGMLLAFNMPAGLPYWMAIVGAFFAIVLVKMAFGGLGKNFVNPALTARILLLISFPAQMTDFVMKQKYFGEYLFSSVDLVSSATPLQIARYSDESQNLLRLFIGYKAGVIGEVSIAALLLGAAYLFARRVIDWTIPVSYIATTLIFTSLFGQDPLVNLLSGGLVLGAFFMATDYVTTPVSNAGKIIFGIGCGLLTGLIRIYGATTEGVSYAILLMNILSPHIVRLTSRFPRRQGGRAHLGLKEKVQQGGENA